MKQLEAVLDFGSSKVVCMIGSCNDEGRFEVHGIGVSEHKGLRKQKFLDEPGLRMAVQAAVDTAQSEAHRRIKRVHVGVPGPFLKVMCTQAELILADGMREVTMDDVDRLVQASLEGEEQPEGMECIFSTPVYFKTDGNTRNKPPVNMSVHRLWGVISHTYLDCEFEEYLRGIIEELGIEIDTFIDSAFAEGLMLIPEKDAFNDAVVVDMGYYHTDVLIVRNSACIYRTTLPVGGAHLASDVAYVLQISPSIAESIKRRHVFGLDYTGRVDTYRLTDGRMESILYEEVQDVLEARAQEMAGMAGECIRSAPVHVAADTPVYLCGGGLALMRGSKEVFQSGCGFHTVVDMPWMPRLNSANFASVYGLLHHVYTHQLGLSSAGNNWSDNRFIQFLINFFTK